MVASKGARSPWQLFLGERFTELHPRLREYFQAIPHGSVGVGEGIFETVGTPRAWLRFLIRYAVDSDVLFPVWERDVPFTVTNSPVGSVNRPAVVAKRVFMFARGPRTMRDRIVAIPDGIVDILGERRRFRALFAATVVKGGLQLVSTRVAVRIGTKHIIFPRVLSPRVKLTEQFSEVDERQHISLTMHMPFIGMVYEYAGSFRYGVTVESA